MNRLIMSLLRFVVVGTLAVGWAAQSQSPNGSTTQSGRNRLQIAEQIFQAHCKTAGETISKTVENVEGVLLMKGRPQEINYHDQYAMTDPYGDDSGGDTYIKTFFSGFSGNGKPGYHYVEAIDSKDGKRYRYTGRVEEPWQTDKHYLQGYTRFVLDRTPATGPAPRYGVTYDDISTPQDRDYWIAGSSLKVIDLRTNEVLAERIGFMMDPGQGNTSGGRSPWLLAARHACPMFPADPGGHPVQTDQTRNFVTKVLRQ